MSDHEQHNRKRKEDNNALIIEHAQNILALVCDASQVSQEDLAEIVLRAEEIEKLMGEIA